MSTATLPTATTQGKPELDSMTRQALEFYRRGIKVSTATWAGAILAHMERQAQGRYSNPEQQLPAIRALREHSEEAENLLAEILGLAVSAAHILKAVDIARASTDPEEREEYFGHAERHADRLRDNLDSMPRTLARLLGLEVEAAA